MFDLYMEGKDRLQQAQATCATHKVALYEMLGELFSSPTTIRRCMT